MVPTHAPVGTRVENAPHKCSRHVVVTPVAWTGGATFPRDPASRQARPMSTVGDHGDQS